MADGEPTRETISSAVEEVLSGADLRTLSSKQVREALERRFGLSLSQRREEIDDILMHIIANKIANGVEFEGLESDSSTSQDDRKDNSDTSDGDSKSSGLGYCGRAGNSGADKTDSTDEENDDNSANEEGDEEFARRLQLEELGVRKRNSDKRAMRTKRTSRGDDSGSTPPRKKRNSAYTQECVLSPELSAIMGTDRLARKDVVSRMWKIFKERNLMDPRNKQYVLCDEQLEKVFKTKKFRAFGMMKILKHHIKDARLVQN